MIKLWNWLTGWYHTWYTKKHNPALYKHLCEITAEPFNEGDYVEVRPEGFVRKKGEGEEEQARGGR